MTDKRSTRSQLLHEVEALRQRVADLERAAQNLPGHSGSHYLILDNMLEGCQIIGFDWRYLYLNAAAIRHSLKTREDLLGHTMMECYPGIETTPLFAVLRRCMEERLTERIENLFRYPDGAQGWFELSIQPIPEGILVLSFDISRHKQAEDALRISEAFLNSIIEHSPYAMWISDSQGTMILQNQASRDLFHIMDEEVVGKYNVFQDTIVAEQGYLPLVQRVFEQGEKVRFTIEYDSARLKTVELKEHIALVLEATISPVVDADGHVIHAVVQHVNITERKRAEAELRRSEERYRTLVDLSPLAIIVNREGRIDFANAAFMALVGASSPEQVLGKAPSEFLRTDNTDRIREMSELRLPTPVLEQQLVRLDGTLRDVAVAAAIFTDSRGDAIQVVLHDITERKQAEEARRESETRFTSIFHASPIGILVTRLQDGVVVESNDASLAMMGYTREEMLGRSTLDLKLWVTPGERDRVLNLLLKQGGFRDQELRFRKKSGDLGDMLASAEVIDYAGEKCILSQIQDITARKQNEKALIESERMLRLFIEHAPAAIAMFDRDMRYLAASRRWLTDYRLKDEDIVGRSHYEVFPEIPERLRQIHQRCLRGAVEKNEAEPFLRADGFLDWVRWEAHPWRDAQGEIGGIMLFSEVITERVQAEEARRASETQYRLLADHMADVIWILDPATRRFLYVSPSVERLLGYTPEETLAQVMDGLFTAASRELVNRTLPGRVQSYLAGDPNAITRRTEVEQRRKDGSTVWAEVVTTFFKDESGALRILGVSRDISERKQAEAEIRQLNAELEQRVIQRTAELEAANQELEAFAYSVSHDLRAPLRAMDGFSRILLEDFAQELSSPAQRYLGLIRENAQQMANLINHLLAFSRLSRQPLNMRHIDPAEVVRQAVEDVRAAREGREVTLVIGTLSPCQADPMLLRQVYVNLLSNALKFTRGRENPTIEVGCQSENGQAVYFVKDNGIGFDMQYAHKLFGVFQRLHRAEDFEGTGVGLAIVQRIIHRHGGRIWVEAEVNRGATFYFTLGETI